MNEDLRAFFERVEAAFCQHRQAPLLLSPLDFEKAAEWFAAGVPPEVVEEGLAEYFARLAARKVPLKRAICLSFAEDRILDALERRRAAAVGRASGVAEPEAQAPRVRRFIEIRMARLEEFASDPIRSAALPLVAKFCREASSDLAALMPKAGQALSTIESRLEPLDRELCRLVLLESPEALVGPWRSDARARLGDLADGMEPDALRQTVAKLACQTGLVHWRLPRLSLLFMED